MNIKPLKIRLTPVVFVINKLKYVEGERDALLGVPVQSELRSYLEGYSDMLQKQENLTF